MAKWDFEHTDTFGGEANYCWVDRETVEIPDNASDRTILRRAKAWAGYTGHGCRVENYGDSFAIYPRGMATVVFANWHDGE